MPAMKNNEAAVVIPIILPFECKIVPAPINPIPVIIAAAILVGSIFGRLSDKGARVNTVEAKQTKMCVLKPAAL